MQTSGRDAWRPREVAGGKIRKIPLPAPPPATFFAPLRQRPLLRPATNSPPTDYPGPSDRPRPTLLPPADDPPSPARKAPAGHPPPDLPPPRCQPPTLCGPAASRRPFSVPPPPRGPKGKCRADLFLLVFARRMHYLCRVTRPAPCPTPPRTARRRPQTASSA